MVVNSLPDFVGNLVGAGRKALAGGMDVINMISGPQTHVLVDENDGNVASPKELAECLLHFCHRGLCASETPSAKEPISVGFPRRKMDFWFLGAP